MRRYITWTDTVDIDIDLDELVEGLSDEELESVGLMRVPAGGRRPTSVQGCEYEPAPSITEHLMLCSWARAKAVES